MGGSYKDEEEFIIANDSGNRLNNGTSRLRQQIG